MSICTACGGAGGWVIERMLGSEFRVCTVCDGSGYQPATTATQPPYLPGSFIEAEGHSDAR